VDEAGKPRVFSTWLEGNKPDLPLHSPSHQSSLISFRTSMISPGEKNKSPGFSRWIRFSLGKLGREDLPSHVHYTARARKSIWDSDVGLRPLTGKGLRGAVVGTLAIDVSLSRRLWYSTSTNCSCGARNSRLDLVWEGMCRNTVGSMTANVKSWI